MVMAPLTAIGKLGTGANLGEIMMVQVSFMLHRKCERGW